jgi:inosose dehydratase
MTTTRRELLFAALAAAWPNAASDLSVESYIFLQYAERQKKPLADVIPEALSISRKAGFKNIELSPYFFAGKLRDITLAALRAENLSMPSMYVGGAMHSKVFADQTIADALEYARMAKPFGCKGIVNNPDPKPNDAAKTYEELYAEADGLNRLGHALAAEGFDLRVHHHTPQLENNAREWRYILANTDPATVHICVDVDWAYEGGFDPVAFLREVGDRLREIHVRSARNKIWLEEVGDSDIDYRAVAAYLRAQNLHPLIVVELAYRQQTAVTRSLEEDLRRSRLYTERVFGITS